MLKYYQFELGNKSKLTKKFASSLVLDLNLHSDAKSRNELGKGQASLFVSFFMCFEDLLCC